MKRKRPGMANMSLLASATHTSQWMPDEPSWALSHLFALLQRCGRVETPL